MDIDIEKIQTEIMEMRKAGLSDGFDEGYDTGYKAAMAQVYVDIQAIIKKTADAEAFKGLSKKVGAAITKKGGQLTDWKFTTAKKQFIDDEKLE